jgi:hypothetical protein
MAFLFRAAAVSGDRRWERRSAGNSSVSAGGEDTLAVDDQEAYNRPPASRPLSSAIAVVSIRPDPALAGREMKITPEADVRG